VEHVEPAGSEAEAAAAEAKGEAEPKVDPAAETTELPTLPQAVDNDVFGDSLIADD
jgi:hypothetical protein